MAEPRHDPTTSRDGPGGDHQVVVHHEQRQAHGVNWDSVAFADPKTKSWHRRSIQWADSLVIAAVKA